MSRQTESPAAPYAGYRHTAVPDEDAELTHIRPGTPCGEYMRRFWQPVALEREIGERPHLVRVLGEDLVLFRNGQGEFGLLHRHCCHRRASLEFGKVEGRGLRCCYHGWLFDRDGTVLETPGEPPESRVREKVFQPAYPVHAYKGIVFAYLGPPEARPAFPVYDTFESLGGTAVPYAIGYDCNWLQIMENSMDPVHSSFLHTSISGPQFSAIFGEIPVVHYFEQPLGHFYTNARRVGENVWIRMHDNIAPNMAQSGVVTSLDGTAERMFGRAGFSRWIVPVDDTHARVIGLRYFGPGRDPERDEDKTQDAFEMLEAGGLRDRPFAERQDNPSDFEALHSQGPIAIHAAETMASTDQGVAILRSRVRRAVRALAEGRAPVQPAEHAVDGTIPSYAGDTVVRMPKRNSVGDDRRAILELSKALGAAAVESAGRSPDDRQAVVADKLRSFAL